MTTKQAAINTLKPGNYVIIDEVACIIKSVQISKPGKHGHTKSRIEAIGLLNNEKKIIVKPGHDNIEVPIVEKKTAQILSIQDDTANVMDTQTYETFDLKIPEELKGQVKENGQVLYWVILNDKIMKQIR